MLLADSFVERNGTVFQILAAVVIAVVTGLVTWHFSRRNRKTKTIDYQVVSDVPILNHRPDDAQLKITYLDEELDHPRVVRVVCRNTGTEVIKASEILEKHRLSVGDAWLVSAVMAKSSAANLTTFEADAGPPGHAVKLTLGTLNPGDEFTLQLVLDTTDDADISLSGRIEGQTRASTDMARLNATRHRAWDRWKLLSGILFIAAAMGLIYVLAQQAEHPWWPVTVAGALFAIGAMSIFDGWASLSSGDGRVRIADGKLSIDPRRRDGDK